MTEPDWVQVGGRVATYDNRGGFHATATVRTIARLTPTLIILDNGGRYRRNSLRQLGDHYGSEILPVNDKRVVRCLEDETIRTFGREVEESLRGYRNNDPARDPNTVLGRVESLLKGARARVDRIQQSTKEPS